MSAEIDLDAVYVPSEDVVAREILGETIIVPLASGIGDMEDELYHLKKAGPDIWKSLDGVRSVREIAAGLADEFDAPAEVIEREVAGLLGELLSRRIVVRKGP